MSAHEAVAALKELGLSNYEAQVFVALQRLATGTAQEVSETSEVPRSQVYGAADDLAERGLVEVVESSPKRYRPVSLAAAREQLRSRIEREHQRAFENLESLRSERADRTDEGEVSTLHGRHAVHERVAALVERASEQVVLIAGDADLISDGVEAALRGRGAAGVPVVVVTQDRAVEERFADGPIRVVVAPPDRSRGFTGRTLLVDDGTVLLSVLTDDGSEPFEETALWTADTRIGRILAEFIHAGMQSGFEGEYPGSE